MKSTVNDSASFGHIVVGTRDRTTRGIEGFGPTG